MATMVVRMARVTVLQSNLQNRYSFGVKRVFRTTVNLSNDLRATVFIYRSQRDCRRVSVASLDPETI